MFNIKGCNSEASRELMESVQIYPCLSTFFFVTSDAKSSPDSTIYSFFEDPF